MMRLYTGPISLFGAKAEIAAYEKAFAIDVVMVPFTIASGYEPKHAEVVRINPKQQIPVLIDGEVEIFDSTQISEYFEHVKPEPALWPASPAERARARLLEMKIDEVLFPNISGLFGQRRPDADPVKIAASRAAIDSFYAEMERQLIGKEYLCGSYSYADIGFFMSQFYAAFLGSPVPAKQERLTDWVRRVAARESVRRAVIPMAQFLKDNQIRVPVESGFSNN